MASAPDGSNDSSLTPIVKGRGAANNPDVRFSARARSREDDGWGSLEAEQDARQTTLLVDSARSVITFNDSPDVPFELSINPYRGCEHGCIYCFARPSHAYLGLSPGLDFETKIAYKPDAPALLRTELARPGYRCSPIALGINTDGWQPIERPLKLTRAILEVLHECRHPVSIVTKSALIERDLDLLADMARENLAYVMFSITTQNAELARRMEPRAATPARRLEALRRVHEAGIPVGVLFAPLIPALNDHDMESVLETSRAGGAETAGYVLLRLPHEIKDLFKDWLAIHAPGKAKHVMSIIRQMRGGKDYDSTFGTRMRGSGVFADVISRRFEAACARLGLNRKRRELDCSRFTPPRKDTPQLSLF
jgi:DNA repair photolyase